MIRHTITGKRSLQRAMEWARHLKSKGYMRNEHWDWTYYPSQEDGYKRIDFWLRDESLLTYMLLRDKAPL